MYSTGFGVTYACAMHAKLGLPVMLKGNGNERH